MKFLILVFLLAFAAITSSRMLSVTRSDLNIGVIRPGDRHLMGVRLNRNPVPNYVYFENHTFMWDDHTRLSFINGTEVGARQFPTVSILRGGLGANNVTIRIVSALGRGFNYSIEFYGQ